MPAHLKRVINQARNLETAPYETMVQHLEREMKLNGLANPESTTFTGIHNVEPANTSNQERHQKQQAHVSVADIKAISSATVGRRTEKNGTRKPPTVTSLIPVKHAAN